MNDLSIRTMRPDEISIAVNWAAAEGWNLGIHTRSLEHWHEPQVFGTLYAEAQRRYLKSVSPYARRLFHQMTVPEVDAIEGLPPTVALQQPRGSPTTRSSVGSVTMLSRSACCRELPHPSVITRALREAMPRIRSELAV